jgi:hypothetical protein
VFLPIEFLNKNKSNYLTINIIERIFSPIEEFVLQRRASKMDRTRDWKQRSWKQVKEKKSFSNKNLTKNMSGAVRG